MEEPGPAQVDGRSARADRTRTAIVDALLALLEEGDLQPTAQRIAARAGISPRIIFHHFGDLEALFRAVAQRQGERMAAMASPIPAELPFDERLDRFVEQRGAMLEWITPVRRASLLQEPFSAELTAARELLVAVGEEQVATLFGPELAGRADRATALAAVATAAGWNTWDALRSSGRTVEEARRAVRLMVWSVLAR